MIRLPIDFRIIGRHGGFSLNNEWHLRYKFNNDGIRVFIETYMNITSEEILICGTLSLSRNFDLEKERMEFSTSMMKGIPTKDLGYLSIPPGTAYAFVKGNIFYSLNGVITITINNDKSADVLKNGESAKCVQSKSLVDNTTTSPTNSLERLSNDFEKLLDPPTSCFADVNLICGDVTIPAHKVILSARSPVFAAMFKNPMKESHQNKVNIDDIEASVLRVMMSYIYTGKTSGLTVMSASDLLFAADKYQLQELKEICCDFMKKNVSLQNVLRLLVSGYLLSQDLKSFAMNYISNKCVNFSTIENTEEWKILRKKRPSLAMDVLTFLVKARDKK